MVYHNLKRLIQYTYRFQYTYWYIYIYIYRVGSVVGVKAEKEGGSWGMGSKEWGSGEWDWKRGGGI